MWKIYALASVEENTVTWDKDVIVRRKCIVHSTHGLKITLFYVAIIDRWSIATFRQAFMLHTFSMVHDIFLTKKKIWDLLTCHVLHGVQAPLVPPCLLGTTSRIRQLIYTFDSVLLWDIGPEWLHTRNLPIFLTAFSSVSCQAINISNISPMKTYSL